VLLVSKADMISVPNDTSRLDYEMIRRYQRHLGG
jgi:hypothetical protein